MRYKICLAFHRSSLQECLETEKPISNELAQMLIKAKIYHFYAFDNRINANRYLLYNIDKNVGMPTWLHIYL